MRSPGIGNCISGTDLPYSCGRVGEWPPDLPNDAVVVRGGLMDRERTAASATAAFRESGVYGLSVWAAPGMGADDIVRLARSHGPEFLPHAKIRTSTVGRLQPYTLEADNPGGHYLLKLPTPPTNADWDALELAFDDPRLAPRKEDQC
jgi:hypothetical protein